MGHIIEILSSKIVAFISASGYPGIGFLMMLESANIPVPSEIVLPFAGFLAQAGRFNLHLAVWAGVLGQLLGSNLSYWLGYWGGRPFLKRFGRFFFVYEKDLERGERWFKRFGEEVVFVSRLMPVVRTFISFPAGILRMKPWKFNLYTLLGLIPWSYFLVIIGFKLGENWESIRRVFRRFDEILAILILVALVFWLFKHLRKKTRV